jgi:hypothetical protein
VAASAMAVMVEGEEEGEVERGERVFELGSVIG